MVNPVTQQGQEVLKKDIQSRAVSKLTQMPEELLNMLPRDKILDLLAYLEAGGRTGAMVFAKPRLTDDAALEHKLL